MDAATVTGTINLALNGLKKLGELVKQHKDAAVKEQISLVYDHVLKLQESISELVQENSSLKDQLRVRTVRRDEKFGYVYLDEETAPICQRCFDDSQGSKRVYLDPVQSNDSGHVWRRCRVCRESYVEKQGEPTVIGSRSNWALDGYCR